MLCIRCAFFAIYKWPKIQLDNIIILRIGYDAAEFIVGSVLNEKPELN